MVIGVVGGRDFNNYQLLSEVLGAYPVSKIVSGGARGADSLGEKYARENNIEVDVYRPDWDKYGKSAGFLRNTTIVENSEIIIAFWDGKSHGTKDTINKCKKNGKEVIVISY